MRDLAEGTKEASDAYGQLAISIGGAIASGALIGSVFGPAGTAVGAILGGLGAIVTGFAGYNSALDETQQKLQDQREEWRKIGEECDEINDSWNQLVTDAQVRINSNELEMQSAEKLTEKLESLFDINGKIKSGYEDRAEFILNELNGALGTEYELTGNQITQNGELYDSYSEIKNEIYNLIEAKRAQAQYEANSTLYKDALSNSQAYYDAMMKAKGANDEAYESMVGFYNYYMNNYLDPNDWATPAISNVRGHLKDFNVTVEDIINNTDNWKNALSSIGTDIFGPMANQLEEEAEAHRQSLRETGEAYERTQNTVNSAIDTIVAHEQLGTALISADQEEISKALENVQSKYDENASSFTNRVGRIIYESNREKEFLKQNGQEMTEEQQTQFDIRLKAVADNLREQTTTVENLTPDVVQAWRMLGEEQYSIYEEQLNKLDPAVRTELQNMTGIVIEKTPEVERVTAELGEKMLDQLDNNSEMRKQAVESVKAYMQGLSDKEQRKLLKEVGIDNAEEVIKGLKQGNLAEDVGINIIKGLRTGLQNDYWQGRTLSTAFNFATNVLSRFKSTFGIQSPSKKTKQFGLYLLEGLGIGIKNGEKDVLGEISNFSKEILGGFSEPLDFIKNGVSVDQNKLAVDTNQFIDYGAVEGSINSNISLNSNLSQIPNLVYNAVIQGMKNSNIQVDIKAETEEGVIVKKASQGFKDYVTQTGELPFPVPV